MSVIRLWVFSVTRHPLIAGSTTTLVLTAGYDLVTWGGNGWESSGPPAARDGANPWEGEPLSTNTENHWEPLNQQENSLGSVGQSDTQQLNPWESAEPSEVKTEDNLWEAVVPSAGTNEASPWDSAGPSAPTKSTWDDVELSASKQQEDSWGRVNPSAYRNTERSWENDPQVSKRLRRSTELPCPPRSSAPVDTKCEELEVPESAVPHIVGQAHRNVHAFRRVPGIMNVCVIKTASTDEKVINKVKVLGSCTDAIDRVIKQVKRLVLRSATNPATSEVTVICFREKKEGEDAISLELATADVFQQYLSKQFKAFVVRFAPEEVQKKQYFTCSRRITSDQLSDNARLTSLKNRNYPGDGPVHLFGSWDSSLYIIPISTCLNKFYDQSLHDDKGEPPLMKVRIQLGKMFFFGTDLPASETWNVALPEMETMTAQKTLKHCFSSFCHPDAIAKARKLLVASGYEHQGLESPQDAICAELVDMDAPTRPTFNIRFMLKDEITAKINRKSRRHAFLTFVDEATGYDFQLRIQSRMKEPVLDKKVLKLVYDAWTKRGGVEEPLISPSGHHYFPLRILRKVFEYYKKDGTEVVLTQVSPVKLPSSCGEEVPDCRWKMCFKQSFAPSVTQNVNETVDNTVIRLAELVAEAKKFSEVSASRKCGEFSLAICKFLMHSFCEKMVDFAAWAYDLFLREGPSALPTGYGSQTGFCQEQAMATRLDLVV
ncbi:hypothetical protein R1flu_018782 [Riccia fluitans]|uniref:Uncharacterized protein n=1 Tax=Riccia fluitans TaxID=41844 RepID=A0ABD1ZGU8_9MARC